MSKVIATVGLHFGDEGKGTIVDYLCRMYHPSTVVRYSGGSQAAHNVITIDDRHHTFAQFGSGTFAGAKTIIHENMIVDPIAFLVEMSELSKKTKLTEVTINLKCGVVTPYHKFIGRMEAIKYDRSTCGMGVGQTIKDHSQNLGITIGDLYSPNLKEKLHEIKKRSEFAAGVLMIDKSSEKREKLLKIYNKLMQLNNNIIIEYYYMKFLDKVSTIFCSKDMISQELTHHNIILEGSQGVLLSKNLGFHPHITQSEITTNNINMVPGKVTKIGVLRSYAHRHGNGPLPTESGCILETHNLDNEWQGKFRTGYFDMVLTKYAVSKNPVDYIALTHMDREFFKICYSYEYDGPTDILDMFCDWTKRGSKIIINSLKEPNTEILNNCKPYYCELVSGDGFIRDLEDDLDIPIKILSYGPTAADKRWRK